MFKKPVWDDMSFVTYCIILLEVATRRWLHCGHKGMELAKLVHFRVEWTLNALLVWTALSLFHLPMRGLLQYSIAELLRLRSQRHLHPDITRLPRRRYIHRGSQRGFHFGGLKGITSFWSYTRQAPRNTGRTVDHSALVSLARSANAPFSHDNTGFNFGLLNIRDILSKISLLNVSLTFSV